MAEGGDNEAEQLRDAVLKTIVEAYYPDRTRIGALARTRAQAAQSAVTLVVGALVGTFTFTVLASQPMLTRLLGLAAVLTWAVTSLLYVRAVAVPVTPPVGPMEVFSADELIRLVLDRADTESRAVDSRQRWANGSAVVALVITAATLAVGTLGDRSRFEKAAVTIDGAQRDAAARACPGRALGASFDADVDMATLAEPWVTVRVDGCPGVRELRVPRDKLIAIAAGKGEKNG